MRFTCLFPLPVKIAFLNLKSKHLDCTMLTLPSGNLILLHSRTFLTSIHRGITRKMGSVRTLCSHPEDPKMKDILDYIDSLKNYEKSGVPRGASTDSRQGFDLGRMRRLMEHFGNPQSKFKAVHIAGTKGKGSTAAFISNILRIEGYSVGCYTSPHIQTIRERILLGRSGDPVSSKVLNNLFHRIKQDLDQAMKEENGCISHFEMEPKKVRKPKGVTWTVAMDEALINAYLHQQDQGNRLGGTFTTHALEVIFKEMLVQFLDKPINKEKMQDHMKYIKNMFSGYYDLFKNGLSGFAWNPITCMWSAEPEVWEKLIESKPAAAEWRDKSIPYYDKLVQLYGKDRATGDHAETTFEIRQRRVANGRKDIHDTIDELDHLISTNEVTLENCGITDEFQSLNLESLGMVSQAHQGSASSKGKKRKSRTEENDFEVDPKSIEKMMDVFEKCTTELVKCYQKHPISEDAIWKQLEDLGIEEDKLEVDYYHLVQHPNDLRALLSCPFEKRKAYCVRLLL